MRTWRPRGLRSRMILQVHDELVLRGPGARGRGAAAPDSRADGGGVAAARTAGGRCRGRLELAGGPLKGGRAAQGAGRIGIAPGGVEGLRKRGIARRSRADGRRGPKYGGVGSVGCRRDRAREARRSRGVPGAGRAVPGPRLRAGAARAAQRGAGTGRGPGCFSQGVRRRSTDSRAARASTPGCIGSS